MMKALKSLSPRLAALSFSLLLTWALLEILLRLSFNALPPGTQGVIQHVRLVPWSERHILRPFPYILSREHQAFVAPGHQDYPVKWGDAQFEFSTIGLWEMPLGFRTEQPRWPVQVVTLGDSFTFCWTDFQDCWAQGLHRDYGWSVMNLGIPGTGTAAHASLLEPYVRPLEPQVVVWQWYANDYMDDYFLAQLRGEKDGLHAPPEPLPPPDYGPLAEYSAAYRLLRYWGDAGRGQQDSEGFRLTVNGRGVFFYDELGSADLSYPAVAYGWDRSLAVLDESQQILQGWGAELVILIIPTKEEVYAAYVGDKLGPEHLAALAAGRLSLLEACQAQGWRCVDSTPALMAALESGETVYHALDFHLDASGNRVITQLLGDYLIAEGLLSDEQE
jgi:hypothetical protein